MFIVVLVKLILSNNIIAFGGIVGLKIVETYDDRGFDRRKKEGENI